MSFPLPTGFDPSKLMEYLASLPDEEHINLLQNAMGKTGEYEEQVQQSRTREGLIKRFRKARSRFVRPGGAVAGQIEPDGVQFSLSNTNAKPNLDMRFLKLLKPMIVRQDMSERIRVEQAKETIPWRDVPKDMETWKKLENEYFGVVTTGNEGSGALACYERAIQAVKEDVG
ncbi:hypothetical protein PRNP1_010269 [Phytophthora ramorum]